MAARLYSRPAALCASGGRPVWRDITAATSVTSKTGATSGRREEVLLDPIRAAVLLSVGRSLLIQTLVSITTPGLSVLSRRLQGGGTSSGSRAHRPKPRSRLHPQANKPRFQRLVRLNICQSDPYCIYIVFRGPHRYNARYDLPAIGHFDDLACLRPPAALR